MMPVPLTVSFYFILAFMPRMPIENCVVLTRIAPVCVTADSYHMVQNIDGGNIDEFDKFPAIRQYFPKFSI